MKFYRQFDQNQKSLSGYQASIIGLTLSSVILLMLSILLTGALSGTFMIWNLFLAALPFGFTYVGRAIITNQPSSKEIRIPLIIALISGFLFWLLLLPNAPYMLTDLIHTSNTPPHLKFYDIVMYSSFGVLGISLFAHSLRAFGEIAHGVLKFNNGKMLLWLELIIIFLSSIGVYLGRALRWNSWDIITQPMNIMESIASLFLNPLVHSYAWVSIIPMFLLLVIVHIFVNYRTNLSAHDH